MKIFGNIVMEYEQKKNFFENIPLYYNNLSM